MSALNQWKREQARGRPNWEKIKNNKKKTKERELQIVKEEVFKATGAIYIVSLEWRPPLAFCESIGNFKEGINVAQENFKTLRRATIVGGLILRKNDRLKKELQRKNNKFNDLLKLNDGQNFH